jgi:hypothetical protein
MSFDLGIPDSVSQLHNIISKTTMAPQSFVPQLRILCLHDANSNASELKDALGRLGERLYQKHGYIDLVYVNSPLVVPDPLEEDSDRPSARVWWENASKAAVEANEDKSDIIPSYPGLDCSLLMLQQVWASCPFWGILSVGQGAAIASLLALLTTTYPPPSFCIFIDGTAILPEEERLIDSLPCLHLVQDSKSDVLIQQFGGQVHERSKGMPLFEKEDLNVIGRFIIHHKKQLFESDDEGGVAPAGQIVALQSALHYTELQAADAIAQEIAKNPPSSLLAVIRPTAVAGFLGNKRRQPGEEGGGAPCPSEFILKRDKRPNVQSDASREHPSQQKQQQNDENKEDVL